MLSEELGRMLQEVVLHNVRHNFGFPEGRNVCTTKKAKDQVERNRCSDALRVWATRGSNPEQDKRLVSCPQRRERISDPASLLFNL
jgi:hypothetical protein